MCHHHPQCPSAQASGRLAAHTVAAHPEQGWNLLCNGVVAFDDDGALLPDGCAIDRGPALSPNGTVRPDEGSRLLA